MCSGRFLTSTSQCYLDRRPVIFYLERELLSIITLLQQQFSFSIYQEKEMLKDENSANTHQQKRKLRKDFLYKVGKVKQNNILYEKENGSQFRTQNQPMKSGKKQEEQQQDFELDICIPPINMEHMTSENMGKRTISQNNREQNDNQYQKNKYVEKQRKENIQDQKQQCEKQRQIIQSGQNYKNQRKQISNKEQQVVAGKQILTSIHTPFVFQDFDQQELQENEQKQTSQAEGPLQPMVQAEKEKSGQNCASEQESLSESHQSQRQIKGVSITSTSLQGNVAIKIINKRQLILSRLPPGIILKCILRKSSTIFYPQYDFYLNNGMKHMLSAKKNSLSSKQIFKVSLELGKYKAKDIIGAIMANTVHNTYWIYKENELNDGLQYEAKGAVRYEKLINNEPRKMKVQLQTDNNKQTKIDAKYIGHENTIEADLVLHSMPLNQKQSSIKNFALIDHEDTQYQYLKMKKVSENMFEVEIQHPLSPLQAFAISLTRFDAQLK